MKFVDKPPPNTPRISKQDAQIFKLVAMVWLIIGCIQIGTGSYMLALTWLGMAVSFYCIGRSAEKKARDRAGRD